MDLGIPGYRWVETIGRGGFGVVHRARDDAHDRDVAIKVLTGAFSDAAVRRFDRERRAMGSVSSHPNVCSVFTSGYTDAGQPFFVMELLSGGSYADRMAIGPLPIDEVIEVGATVSDALRIAHDAGILHCDVKPANILRSSYGSPMLSDFGIANLQAETVTVDGISATPAFAAPEVLQGEPATTSSDIYSLGATLYALTQGQLPFVRTGTENAFAVMGRVITEPVPVISRADVPDALRALLTSTMDKDPARRPASMAALRDALVAVRDGAGSASLTQHDDGATVAGFAPLAATPTPSRGSDLPPALPAASPNPPPRRSHRAFVGLGIAAILLLAVITFALRSDKSTATTTTDTSTTLTSPTTLATATTTTDPVATTTTAPTTTSTPPETTAAPTTAPPPPVTSAPAPVAAAAPTPTAPPPPTVPNVVGLRLPFAVGALDGAGYASVWPGHCENLVTGQDPAAGTVAKLGATVSLFLVPCIVPNIVGLRLAEAAGRLEAVRLGIRWPNYCDDIVTSQFPEPGTELEPDDVVFVTLVSC